MPLNLQWFVGQRANAVIYHGGDGYFFHINNNRPNRRFAYLKCAKSNCSGTAKVLRDRNLLYHLSRHDHPSNVLYPQLCSLRKDIIARVRAGDQTALGEIIDQEGQRYCLNVRSQLDTASLEVRLHAIRASLRPAIPRSIGVMGALLALPEYQWLTRSPHVPDSIYHGMCGNIADGTLSLVFITPDMQAFMQTRSMVFVDGTERKLFRKPKASQIYVISTVWRYKVITMLRAIMQKRTEAAYDVLFNYLKEALPNFRPHSVKCDFEDAQINAWRNAFPHVKVEGCLWHYDVAIWSHAKNKLGLYRVIQNSPVVSSLIRSAGALPLLPSDDIPGGLLDIAYEAQNRGHLRLLRPFFRYMDREWMPKVRDLSVCDSDHRTNNASESSNRMLNRAIKVSSPNCFDILRAFVMTNERATVDMRRLRNVLAPVRGRRVSVLRNDVRIRRLTTDYRNGDITRLQFLRRASRRMQNVFNRVFR